MQCAGRLHHQPEAGRRARVSCHLQRTTDHRARALRDQEALLSSAAFPELDEHRGTQQEFEYLATDIITTDNFEMSEIHRFVTLWWVGHLIDSVKKYRAFFVK